ncbi:hypothetical protein BDF20DRAFT_824686, partial [Mycotypha africana]|uniref:uncharacterized protein n=1 Tax=Mycotypha africana TaxID=64632 RepID=UPI0023017C4C
FRSLFYSSSTVYAFCTNLISKNMMAVCLRSEIQEIDISKASNCVAQPLARIRSASSNRLSQETHIDSYPDTEEDDTDMSDNDQEYISTTTIKQTNRKQFPTARSAKVSGNSSPLVSPAGSRTFDEHVQRVPQTLNIEHLHETLRKSLTRASDGSKTPTSASPALMDSTERERMIMMKRPISTTCIEAHPQYPFCMLE